MKKNKILNPKEKLILKYIKDSGGNVSAHEISESTGISYVTVKKYLTKLINEKILVKKDD